MKKFFLLLSLTLASFTASEPSLANQKDASIITAPSENKEQSDTNDDCYDNLDDPNSPTPKELGEAPTGY